MTVLDQNKAHHRFFEELTKIPHGSHEEKQMSDFLVNFAKERGLDYYQDDIYNVIIYKKATAGYEDHPTIMIQAHMDMVCEKNEGVEHDFTKDPIDMILEDGILRANGTTLGADDGAGVAYMLAILDDATIAHPALECLFTVQEETTMEGAMQIDPAKISARRLINVDSEKENFSITSSCGGTDWYVCKDVEEKEVNKEGYKLVITGLTGGHSGSMIHMGKGNSIQLTARMLYKVAKEMKVNLSTMVTNGKVNAIPRECEVVFTCEGDPTAILAKEAKDIQGELEFTDNGFTYELTPVHVEKTMCGCESKKLFSLLHVMPNGMLMRSDAQDGLTVSSNNMGVAHVGNGKVMIEGSCRGNLTSYFMDTYAKIEALATAYGYEAQDQNYYPCWGYKANSPLRDAMVKTHKEVYGFDMTLEGRHAGLECGIFDEKFPEMDIITFGPTMNEVHSPSEWMSVPSFDKVFEFLTALLKAL